MAETVEPSAVTDVPADLTEVPADPRAAEIASQPHSAPQPSVQTRTESTVSLPWSDISVRSGQTDASWSTLWLTDRDIQVFTVLAAVVLGLLAWRWVGMTGWGREPIEIERFTTLPYSYRLDLNTASAVELGLLEGVGETLAERIVASRETDGPFTSVDDLDRVRGIGPKTLERLRPYLAVAPNPEPAEPAEPAEPPE